MTQKVTVRFCGGSWSGCLTFERHGNVVRMWDSADPLRVIEIVPESLAINIVMAKLGLLDKLVPTEIDEVLTSLNLPQNIV